MGISGSFCSDSKHYADSKVDSGIEGIYGFLYVYFLGRLLFIGPGINSFDCEEKKEGLQGLLKKFLLLTGASAVGFFVFVLLHNVVYGLFGVEEPFFFILAVIVCPLGFLVGAIGTIVLFFKKGKRQ